MKEQKFSVKSRWNSFRYALKGLNAIWKSEINFRIEILLCLGIILTSLFIQLEIYDWIALIIPMSVLLIAELFNTALENSMDQFHPNFDPLIGQIKDIAAAAVLIAAVSLMCIFGILMVKQLN
ncbi:MAG: diacylglycerol kinase [Flavobacteriales bacterium]|nr:diacylglycerol kinase [Flavobacteriales bacterium]